MTIRQADPSDADAISLLTEALGHPPDTLEVEHRLRRIHSSSRSLVIVYCDSGGEVLAWLHAEHRTSLTSGERAEIVGLVVDSSHRRKGFARALIAYVEQWASARGAPELIVRSNTTRHHSGKLYPALGFSHMKRQDIYVKRISP